MKTSRTFCLVITALVVGFVAARWCFAQSTNPAPNKESAIDNNFALEELESFVAYLQETKQTNALKRFDDYSNVSIVSRSSADLGVRLYILYSLRTGHTNEAINVLEARMTSDVVAFAASYRDLPVSIREKVSLTAFRRARDYCRKYPVRSGHSDVDEIVMKAFTLLDEQAAK
ncbi:MAG TPA: hypothetical protein VFV96_16920 [Verrucomicrobiae bacterium]|nr:hypothetical protein [Verrucomicrobiae bacterium]